MISQVQNKALRVLMYVLSISASVCGILCSWIWFLFIPAILCLAGFMGLLGYINIKRNIGLSIFSFIISLLCVVFVLVVALY